MELIKRKWYILYIYTCKRPFYKKNIFKGIFIQKSHLTVKVFNNSFVLPEIHSMSLQYLLIQESINVHTREPTEIDNKVHVEGGTYFCPECYSIILIKKKQTSI